MITALLLLVCLVLAGAVTAQGVAVRRLRERVSLVEKGAQQPSRDQEDDGLVAGAGAPSSTSGVASAPSSTSGYMITRLGDPDPEPVPTLETKLFADVVLREAVVKAASFAYGVRRGLAPANRNRIWFEMRREVKRARKERRAEEREAIREYRARRRAAVRVGPQEESAA